jgi:signal transduction histidine kinase
MRPAVRQQDASPQIAPARGAPTGEAVLDEPKKSFLRIVSHELRTPLNSILGFSEILASELYGPLGVEQYREYAQIIRSSGEKLLKLVNQVVEIARLQAGEMEIDLQAERLDPIFDALGDDLHEAMAARGLRLVTPASTGAEALADARALRTVLSHLLQNAVAFSPDGGLIEVSLVTRPDQLEIVMRNEGDGVDSVDLERLLRPFEQGENALTRHAEGAGLGLAICDLTCKAMGAQLKLVSGRGQGFAAHIVLPAL